MSESNLVRYEEAVLLLSSTTDPKLRAAQEYALATVLMRRRMHPTDGPELPFDLVFFVAAIRAMFEDEAIIRAIVDGSDDLFRW